MWSPYPLDLLLVMALEIMSSELESESPEVDGCLLRLFLVWGGLRLLRGIGIQAVEAKEKGNEQVGFPRNVRKAKGQKAQMADVLPSPRKKLPKR